MPVWAIVVVAIVAVVIAMILAGIAVSARRRRAQEGSFQADVELANRALATAHADDKGWDRAALEAAARAALQDARPGAAPRSLHLVEVVDRPGVEEDKAVFVAETEAGPVRIELGRDAGGWTAERVG